MSGKVMLLSALAALILTGTNAETSRPNIIYILADDMGWNDVGFTGRSDLQTPNIDALAYNGRILTQHYALPSCTPSRSALLTGKYPIRIGMQGYPLSPTEPRGLPLDQRLMPQYMKELGYQTHLVGKWHLGYHEWRYTPIGRSCFDSHFGYFNGFIGYYDHLMIVRNQSGHDFWHNSVPQYNLKGRYVTDLLTEESVRLINAAAPSGTAKKAPLFLLVSQLAPHAGNPGKDLEYPDKDLAMFDYIKDENRRKYAAMVWNLDKSVGRIVEALAKNKMLDNSIIVFASDNGAQTIGMYANDGSNYPMKGLKFSIFEGGVRTVAAVWSPKLHGGGRGVSKQLFHMADWLPTLYEAVGGDRRQLSGMDGRSQWEALQKVPAENPDNERYAVRKELLVNIDEAFKQGAVISKNLKIIRGSYVTDSTYDNYWGTKYLDTEYTYNASGVSSSLVASAFKSLNLTVVNPAAMQTQRDKTIVHCSPPGSPPPAEVACDAVAAPCLFDILNDPCERINLASSRPGDLKELLAKLETYEQQMKAQLNVPNDPEKANPASFNNTWISWVTGIPPIPTSSANLNFSSSLILCLLGAFISTILSR